MKRVSKSALIVGLLVATVALAGALFSWWRWERIAVVEGDIALPPGSKVVRVSEPSESGSARVYTVQNRRPQDALKRFLSDELRLRGWEREDEFDNVVKYTSGNRNLRVVFHKEKGRTKFTLSIKPCR